MLVPNIPLTVIYGQRRDKRRKGDEEETSNCRVLALCQFPLWLSVRTRLPMQGDNGDTGLVSNGRSSEKGRIPWAEELSGLQSKGVAKESDTE